MVRSDRGFAAPNARFVTGLRQHGALPACLAPDKVWKLEVNIPMNTNPPLASRRAPSLCLGAVFLASLAACGGGGGSSAPSGPATVSSATAGTPKYGQTLNLNLSGANLDQGNITVTATGCTGVAIVAAQSNANSAVYQCTVSALGAGQFTVTGSGGGAPLASAAFTVPAPQVTLTVSNGAAVGGTLVMTLAPDKAPITVNNFLSYVNSGFYAGTVFHRVSPGFVIQGGGYTAPLDANNQNLKATNAPIALEVGKGLSNTQWTVAMARSSADASATSQFFINLVDNSSNLDPGLTDGYAVFGTVTSTTTGTVTAIAGAPCVALPFFLPAGECTPTPNVVINSAVQTQ